MSFIDIPVNNVERKLLRFQAKIMMKMINGKRFKAGKVYRQSANDLAGWIKYNDITVDDDIIQHVLNLVTNYKIIHLKYCLISGKSGLE